MPKLAKDPRLSSETEEMPRADSVVDRSYGNRSPSELITDTSDDLESLTNPTDPRDDGLLRRLREDAEKGLSIDTIIAFFKNTPPEVLRRELEQEDPKMLEPLSAVVARLTSASPSASKTAPKVAANFDAAVNLQCAAPASDPTPRTADSPPLWGSRGTDCQTSVIDWIKKHYSYLIGEVDAETGRRNRERLADADPKLARAYSSTVRSNRRQELPGLPVTPRPAPEDPAVALQRRKDQDRRASEKYRVSTRIT